MLKSAEHMDLALCDVEHLIARLDLCDWQADLIIAHMNDRSRRCMVSPAVVRMVQSARVQLGYEEEFEA